MISEFMAEVKPDFEEARAHWAAFWSGDVIDRPCISINTPRDGAARVPGPAGLCTIDDDPIAHIKAYEEYARTRAYLGDSMPYYYVNFGPDIFSAFLGAELEYAFEEGASWARPFVTDWKSAAPGLAAPRGRYWDGVRKWLAAVAEHSAGAYGIGVLDLHSNMDCASAIRGPQELCLDIFDCPDEIDVAMHAIGSAYKPVFDGLREASGGNGCPGSGTWLNSYSEGRYDVPSCDSICLVSPEQARRFVIPAIEEEANFLDHSCYHCDGPGAIPHLDDILAIEAIKMIQWVPGAGAAPFVQWIDLLRHIRSKGKSIIVTTGSADEVKFFHREFGPRGVFYDVWLQSENEGRELIRWLAANT